MRLQVSRDWIKRRIHNGTIDIRRDAHDKRFLFPDTADTIAALQEIKSGKRNYLRIAQRPSK
jgi:hypothetical protein